MTKRVENSPTAKTRIREYISAHNLQVKSVEVQCGYSNGFLSAGGEIGSDRLAMFVENFPDADLYYIVTGSSRKAGHGTKFEEFQDKVFRMSSNKEQMNMAYDIAMSALDLVGKTYDFFSKKGM